MHHNSDSEGRHHAGIRTWRDAARSGSSAGTGQCVRQQMQVLDDAPSLCATYHDAGPRVVPLAFRHWCAGGRGSSSAPCDRGQASDLGDQDQDQDLSAGSGSRGARRRRALREREQRLCGVVCVVQAAISR